MTKMLIDAAHEHELRVVIVDDNNKLIDLDISRPGLQQRKGNIYKGKISSIEPSLDAVFVNYGQDRHGFLPLKEISPEYFLVDPDSTTKAADAAHTSQSKESTAQQPNQTDSDEKTGKAEKAGKAEKTKNTEKPERRERRTGRPKPDINKVLRVGQEVVVQVDKEERGNKGAALTTYISLAGAYLVLMPNNPQSGGISRKIAGVEREDMRNIIQQLNLDEGQSMILRTAGVGRSQEELQWDLHILMCYWNAIKQAAILKPGPYLIHSESDVMIRSIRDYLRPSTTEAIINSEEAFDRAKRYMAQTRPDFMSKVSLYTKSTPIFTYYDVEQQIDSTYLHEIRLKSGGAIVIDHTEALVSIDVNSSRSTKGHNIEETALATNLEAAEEIARQLRLRDIGGLIVIDFIDMGPFSNQREVENILRKGLSIDRARIQVGRISRFGLLEMSRQRIRSSIGMQSLINCANCNGTGKVRAVESMSLAVVRDLRAQAANNRGKIFILQLPIDISTYVINEKRNNILEIEKIYDTDITIIPNPYIKSPEYHITCKTDKNKKKQSYSIAKPPQQHVNYNKSKLQQEEEPIISKFLAETEKLVAPYKTNTTTTIGLLKQLWNKMFASTEEEPKKPTEQQNQKKHPQSRRTYNTKNRNRNYQHGNRNKNPNSRTQNQQRTHKADSNKNTQGSANPEQKEKSEANTKPQAYQGQQKQQKQQNTRRRTQNNRNTQTDKKVQNKTQTQDKTNTDKEDQKKKKLITESHDA